MSAFLIEMEKPKAGKNLVKENYRMFILASDQ
jgi:hypothetical protein